MIELLAYQFASVVRWIEIQDQASEDSVSRSPAIFNVSKNQKEIYYSFEDELETPPPSSLPTIDDGWKKGCTRLGPRCQPRRAKITAPARAYTLRPQTEDSCRIR
ncbi:hypothetical protein BDZ89DRAFT_1140692 [Hymenopellis radicata]|nr:hypothetical protein BDZ89DRAFT_1140692 [Hymenopellis radicata]